MRLFRIAIDSNSPALKGKEKTTMEEQHNTEQDTLNITSARKDAMIHDLILVVKSAMVKVNGREQMWCDILASTEKQIRRVVDENTK